MDREKITSLRNACQGSATHASQVAAERRRYGEENVAAAFEKMAAESQGWADELDRLLAADAGRGCATPPADGWAHYQLTYSAEREMHLLRCGSITVQIPRVSNAQTFAVERLVVALNAAEKQAALLDAAMRTMDGFIAKFGALFSKAEKDNGVRTGDVEVSRVDGGSLTTMEFKSPAAEGIGLGNWTESNVTMDLSSAAEMQADPPAQTWRDREPLL